MNKIEGDLILAETVLQMVVDGNNLQWDKNQIYHQIETHLQVAKTLANLDQVVLHQTWECHQEVNLKTDHLEECLLAECQWADLKDNHPQVCHLVAGQILEIYSETHFKERSND